jgi:hypothetical protein
MVGSASSSILLRGRHVIVYSTTITLATVAYFSKLCGCYIISGPEIACRFHLTRWRVRRAGAVLFMKLNIARSSVITFILYVVKFC